MLKSYSTSLPLLFTLLSCTIKCMDQRQANNDRLVIAAQEGDSAMVRFLLTPPAFVNAKFSADPQGEGSTPLAQASQNGHFEIVQFLVQNKADVNLASGRVTPLLQASQNGHSAIVDFLLLNQADPNLSADDSTPLTQAAQNNHVKIVESLLKAKANPNLARPKKGCTPLLESCMRDHTEIVEQLLLAKADPDVQIRKLGKNGPLMGAIANGHTNIVKRLLQEKVDPNNADERGFAPLMSAAEKGKLQSCSLLLEAKARVNTQAKIGNNACTALTQAALNGHSSIVNLLIQANADINKPTSDGYPPLHIAVDKEHEQVVKVLVAAGARQDLQNIDGLYLKDYVRTDDMRKLLQASSAALEHKDPK